MTRKLNYVSFSVSDMQKVVDFYRTLGLPRPEDVDTTQEHIDIQQDGLQIAWETQEMIQGLDPEWGDPRSKSEGRVLPCRPPRPPRWTPPCSALRTPGTA